MLGHGAGYTAPAGPTDNFSLVLVTGLPVNRLNLPLKIRSITVKPLL